VDEAQHPPTSRLLDFAVGSLGDDDLAKLSAHLDECDTCRTQVDRFLESDAFLERLQSASHHTGGLLEDVADRRRAARALRREIRNTSRNEQAAETAEARRSRPGGVGEYVLLREVGRGGMGVVYQARHRSLQRLVALKMILAGGFASESQRQRFRREAELAARVQHPNIVQVYEIGEQDGHPFLAMEWVEGGTLAEKIGSDPWPPEGAAQLVEILARAIDAAHKRDVVHRDLKPSNILLQSDPGAEAIGPLAGAVPKVADFGLARATNGEAVLTSTGMAVGTPEYVAPEQAAGNAVGPAADIYALGVILYQLLAGQPPFRGTTPMEVLQALAQAEPVAPRRFRPNLPRDLETIALKAIEKEPSRRYPTAGAMADDLRRFLRGESIQARPATALARLLKWAGHRPALAALAGTLAAVTILGFLGVTALWVDAAKARDQARAAATEARQRGDAERRARYQAGIAAASSALELNNTSDARAQLESTPEEHRNWEWRHFSSQLDTARTVLRGHAQLIKTLAISPDGSRLVSGAEDGKLALWDLRTGELISLARVHSGAVTNVGFSPDSKYLATAGADGLVRLRDPRTSAERHTLRGHSGPVLMAIFSPDGKVLATASEDKTVRCWNVQTGEHLGTLQGHTDIVRAVAFSPDCNRLASVGRDLIVRLWDLRALKLVATLKGHTAGVHALAYRPDGKVLATGGDFPDSTVRLWNAANGSPLAVLTGHENEIGSLAFSPDGTQLVSASLDQTVRLWDGSSGHPITTMRGHSGWVNHVSFSPDGRRLVSSSHDQTLRLWDAAKGDLIAVLRGHMGSVWHGAFNPGGGLIASASSDRTVRLWDAALIERNGVIRGHKSYVYDVAFSPDGARLASSAWDHSVRLWDVEDGRQTDLLHHDATTGGINEKLKFNSAYIVSLAFQPVGKLLASVSRDNLVYLWDLTTGRPTRVLKVPTDDWEVHPRAAFSPTGELLATGGADGMVRLWDPVSGELMAALGGHEGCASDVVFSPDGAILVSAGSDGTVRLWDVATHEPIAVFIGHDGPVHRVAFSPDYGTPGLLASASQDHTVRLWRLDSRSEQATLGHGSPVYGLAFSPDGTRLATACADNSIRLWDVATGSEAAELRGHGAYVHAIAFSPDGTRLASCSGDRTVRIWDSLTPQEREGR
jgi:WD40 repeat protein